MVTFRYLGISAFEVVTATGIRLLIDPCLSENSLCPITVEEVGTVDLILVTHGAPDHMGDAIEIQRRTGATIIAGPAVRVHAWNSGVPQEKVIAILWGDRIETKGIAIQGVECRHVSFFQSGNRYLAGLPLSFIIYPEEGVRIYNVGDSALFSDMKLIGELYQPNIALIPIGGTPQLTGGYSHLPPREAALATQWSGVEYVIPTHFQPGTDEATHFTEYVQLLAPHTKVVVMEPGESRSYDPATQQFL